MTRLTETHRNTDARLGALLKELRKQAGISQMEIAAAIGVTFQQVQKYEKGSNRVAVSTLIAMCQALKVNASDVVAAVTGAEQSQEGTVRIKMTDRIRKLESERAAIQAILDKGDLSDLPPLRRAPGAEQPAATVQ
jgi:transcriptional regulator with XRE-family HTH domain